MTAYRSHSHAIPFAIVRLMLIAGVVALIILNVQPWYKVTSPFFSSAVIHVPLLSSVIEAVASIWWVGKPLAGLLLLICEKATDIAVLLLCGLVNLAQTAEMMLRLRGIEADAIAGSGGVLAKRVSGFLELLAQVRVVAYLLELAVCFAAYKIYGDGPAELLKDLNIGDLTANTLDSAKWNWGDIGMSCLTMFGFEGILAVILGLWSGLGVLTLLFNASQAQPQPVKVKAK